MGLKSFIVAGFSVLGIKTKLVALTHRGKDFEVEKNYTADVKSLPTMLQYFLKKWLVNPSGPGDFPSGMENKAPFISSEVTRLTILLIFSDLIVEHTRDIPLLFPWTIGTPTSQKSLVVI